MTFTSKQSPNYCPLSKTVLNIFVKTPGSGLNNSGFRKNIKNEIRPNLGVILHDFAIFNWIIEVE